MTTTFVPSLPLPEATPISTRGASSPVRPRSPIIALGLLGLVLTVSPFAFGLFGKAAAADQMLSQFAPLVTDDRLAAYDADLALFSAQAATLREVYRHQRITPGTYPQIDAYLASADDLTSRNRALLDQVRGGTGDLQRLHAVTGFNRLPLLLLGAGLLTVCGAAAAWRGDRRAARNTLVATALGGLLVAGYPFASGLASSSASADALVDRFTPVMSTGQVRALQNDFITLVGATGETDAELLGGPLRPADRAALQRVVDGWPAASADFADLTGSINDNLANFAALQSFSRLSPVPGVSGFQAAPYALTAVGLGLIVLAALARPRTARARTDSDSHRPKDPS